MTQRFIEVQIGDFLGQPIVHRLYNPVTFKIGRRSNDSTLPKQGNMKYTGNRSLKTPRDSKGSFVKEIK